MLDRGRDLAAARRADRPALAALVRRRRAAARPALPPPRRSTSGCSRTAASMLAARRGAGAPAARGARALRRRGRRDLPAQRLRRRGPRAPPPRADARGARRRVAVSISSETSPLAKEYARASTTVVDVFMKLIFTGYAHELDERAPRARLRRRAQLRRLRGDAAARGSEALEQPFRIVFAGPAAGTISSARLGEAIGDGNLALRRRRRHLDRRLARRRRAAVRQQHVRARARPGHQRALDRDLERRRRRRQHRLDLAVRRRRRRPGERGLRSRARPATAAAAREPTVTDACLLMGILDPDGFAGGEMRLDAELARQAFESLDDAARLRASASASPTGSRWRTSPRR